MIGGRKYKIKWKIRNQQVSKSETSKTKNVLENTLENEKNLNCKNKIA